MDCMPTQERTRVHIPPPPPPPSLPTTPPPSSLVSPRIPKELTSVHPLLGGQRKGRFICESARNDLGAES